MIDYALIEIGRLAELLEQIINKKIMKVKVKSTGEIIDVVQESNPFFGVGVNDVLYKEQGISSSCRTFKPHELEFVHRLPKEGIDWQQRRYEIAKDVLPCIIETSRQILMSGSKLCEDDKGKTVPEICSSVAVDYADALITELKKSIR